ncbi:MAG: MBL fold metallo-hydrolase [Gemmatimonadota bacterium]
MRPSPETFSPAAFAGVCESWDDWEKPAPPFRVYGGTYYVGTCGISAILITSPEGHLLIDSGTEPGGELVATSIQELGFSLGDVRYLTHTQEHGDHIGGLAYLKENTDAQLVASPRAWSVFETAVLNTDDPQYTPDEPRAWLSVDKLVADGEALELGPREWSRISRPGTAPVQFLGDGKNVRPLSAARSFSQMAWDHSRPTDIGGLTTLSIWPTTANR